MNTKEKVKIAYDALEEKKGEELRILSVGEVTLVTDYFLIATGNNPNQVRAMADEVEEKLGKAGCHGRIEGYRNAEWILMDYEDIIIQIFARDARQFYDLERIWRDANVIFSDEL